MGIPLGRDQGRVPFPRDRHIMKTAVALAHIRHGLLIAGSSARLRPWHRFRIRRGAPLRMVRLSVGLAIMETVVHLKEEQAPMGEQLEVPALSDHLLGYWSARRRFRDAGLATNLSDPIGGLAEALTAAALWPDISIRSAYYRARVVRTSQDGSGRFGPALGSMPESCNGRANSLAVDLAMPWLSVIQAVPVLAEFAKKRQAKRRDWDRVRAAAADAIELDNSAAYAGLARVQVKARFAPDAPNHVDLNAVPFEGIRDGGVPANDLYVLVMFACVDENCRNLRDDNFVWTAVILTDEGLRALDPGTKSAKLGWIEVHSWWHEGRQLPDGSYDVTSALREISIPGW
jgi:hypothetical protein